MSIISTINSYYFQIASCAIYEFESFNVNKVETKQNIKETFPGLRPIHIVRLRMRLFLSQLMGGVEFSASVLMVRL